MLSPSSMTIWNSDTGTAVSRFAFTEVVMAFAFDPFIAESLISEPNLLCTIASSLLRDMFSVLTFSLGQ